MSDVTAAAAPTSAPTQSSGTSSGTEPMQSVGANATEMPQARQPDGTQPPETAAQRRVRLALEGDEEKEYDLATLRANYAKGKNAAQMMSRADALRREALEARRQSEAIWEALQDPQRFREIVSQRGLDPNQLAEQLLLPEIQKQMMSEDQRRTYEREQALSQKEQQIRQWEQQQEQARHEALVMEQQKAMGQQMVNALQKLGIPKESSGFAIMRMAALKERQMDLGLDLSDDDIATLVREDLKGEQRSMTSTMDGNQLLEWFGDDTAKKMMSAWVARTKPKTVGQTTMTQPPAQGSTNGTNGARKASYLSPSEAEKILREKISSLEAD